MSCPRFFQFNPENMKPVKLGENKTLSSYLLSQLQKIIENEPNNENWKQFTVELRGFDDNLYVVKANYLKNDQGFSIKFPEIYLLETNLTMRLT